MKFKRKKIEFAVTDIPAEVAARFDMGFYAMMLKVSVTALGAAVGSGEMKPEQARGFAAIYRALAAMLEILADPDLDNVTKLERVEEARIIMEQTVDRETGQGGQ